MTGSSGTVLRALLLGAVLVSAPVEDLGVSGYVVGPDGTAVSSGSVVMQSQGGGRTTSSIDDAGRFRVVPNLPGVYRVVVSVPGFAPYRVLVDVPRSKTLKLPPIRLSPATYFRVRFTSAAGEPIISPQLRRRSFDADGPIPLPDDRGADQIGSDGTITIGPLPRGLTTLVLDTPPLAQTRVPNLSVTGEKALFDGGTVIVQPGAVLQVDVVDEGGAPVPQHDVFIEDVRPLSPMGFAPARTDQQGRATFDRLSAGRYRLRSTATERCGNELLSIAPLVPVPGSGTVRARLVVAGHATFRVTSPLGPLRGSRVSASPDAVLPPSPMALRLRDGASLPRQFREVSCSGATDYEGRVTLSNFPPGPARVAVRLLNSVYERRVNVPIDGGEIAIFVPEAFLPVRVTDARKKEPIAGAVVTWTSNGGRIEATSSTAGDVLLEGIGTTAGTLACAAAGYQSAEEALPEPPTVLHEVTLVRTPDRKLQARVVTVSGEPVPAAVVELASRDPMEIPRVSVTDQKGLVTFPDAPAGSLRLTAGADGFVTAATSIAEDHRTGIVLTLARERGR
jgi:hypothetical protein